MTNKEYCIIHLIDDIINFWIFSDCFVIWRRKLCWEKDAISYSDCLWLRCVLWRFYHRNTELLLTIIVDCKAWKTFINIWCSCVVINAISIQLLGLQHTNNRQNCQPRIPPGVVQIYRLRGVNYSSGKSKNSLVILMNSLFV